MLDFFQKVIYRQRREEFGSPVCRKDMIWSCKIISKRLTAVFSDKDGTRIANLGHHGKCIFCHDFQMLRCDFVCSVDRVIQRLGDQNMPIVIQRFLNDLASGELFYKSVHFPGYTSSASSSLVVTRIADASSSCSAWDRRSAATSTWTWQSHLQEQGPHSVLRSNQC